MNGKAKPAPSRPAPRLYLATPVLDDPASLAARLHDLLVGLDIAAVLVRLAPSDPRTLTERAKVLAKPIQAAGAACLLDNLPGLVARAGADGAHVHGVDALKEALPGLKPDRIAGCGHLATRHEAMTAGEIGADYVLFGEPDDKGHRPAPDDIAERLGWWAELFEPPCVGYAASLAEAAGFAAAGADFILADDLVWSDDRGARAALEALQAAIGPNAGGGFGTALVAGAGSTA